MPFFILTLLIQAGFVIHVLKTGRNTIWIWIVVLLPLAGSLAYIAIELLPGLVSGRTARRAASGVRRTLDPNRDLRNAKHQLRVTESIESRRRLADELFANGDYADAQSHYRAALTGLYETDPLLLLGVARSQFALRDFPSARATLDLLIEKNPEFRSQEGHLLYARALEEEGNLEKAAGEYRVLVKGYTGAEARYRQALLMRRMGQEAQARAAFELLIEDGELSAKHYRRDQKEWLDAARREVASR
ncbi:MAG TPA: tetratricopeptide repeat protein [Steroidobacteraceae bacterium]|nr:tetratricopeptide repeat protein [Steroidobacteraceae bacterium]